MWSGRTLKLVSFIDKTIHVTHYLSACIMYFMHTCDWTANINT